jgi:tRNA(Ile)-lysidine synthase
VTTSKSESLARILNSLPAARHYCVAYSGGVDSHVLLHLLATRADALPARLTAVHVDHQIQHQSGDWTLHCRAICEELGVAFECLQVDGRARPGESPEAAARRARYRALAAWLPKEAVLLTAQHQDDQAETLLLQLFRGAGPRGLAAMPALAPLGRGKMARPLLPYTRQIILDYAHQHKLCWVEDPSNDNLRYDRNLLRHQLMPLLRQHWPGIDRVLARAAGLQADQAELAQALAEVDLRACEPTGQPDQLDCSALQALDPARQRNLLRHWLEDNALSLPTHSVLEQLRNNEVNARSDASPCVRWPGAEVRRYRNRLYAMSPLPVPDPAARFTWDIRQPLELPQAGGKLTAVPSTGCGLRVTENTSLEIRFRQGGEVLQPTGRHEHHRLKKLFQEWHVPDWERARVPLIYTGDVLVAVAGLCVCEGFQADSGEPGYRMVWSRMDRPFSNDIHA